MDEFFNSLKVGIKTLTFPPVDEKLSISIKGCLSVEIRTEIPSKNKDFTIVYKNTEYQCDVEIVKYFIKSPLKNNRLELKFDNDNDDGTSTTDDKSNRKDDDDSTSGTSKEDLSDEKVKTNSNSINPSEESLSNNNDNTDETSSEIQNDKGENDDDNSSNELRQEDLSDEESFVFFVFLKFFNGIPVVINGDNLVFLKFISEEKNLNIPSFLKICEVFDKFYEIYDKMDPISDIQYDLINIDDLIGFRENKSEISQNNSFDFLEQDIEPDDSITAISSFGSLFFTDLISPSRSVDFIEKITEVVDDIVDRIASEPALADNITLLYNILIEASIYRPENIKFYIKIIKQLDDPQPQGKGIKIIDVIRKLYLHNINQSTDFFILHEMMLGGIFTVKEVLDVVKESTSLEFKIWFAPYIEEAEAARKQQNNNNNNNDDDDNDDDSGYGNVIQDIEDRIYSISEPEKREFKVHFFSAIRENGWALHRILARQGANHTPVARAIRRDDVKKLQKILAFDPKTSVDDVIKWSAFDHIQFLMNSPTLIQYAAFYGAVKCFKYLMLNQANLDKMDGNKQYLINYAVAGGNTEIVRICIQQKVPTYTVLSSACLFYRFDLLDWILENVFPTIKGNSFKQASLQSAFLNSLESFNFISILKLFQFIDESALYKSAAVDNELVLDILNLFQFSREEKVYMLLCSTESHNFDFFKQIFSTLKIKLKDNSSNDSALEAFDDDLNEIEENNDENNNNARGAAVNQNNNNFRQFQLIERSDDDDDDNNGNNDAIAHANNNNLNIVSDDDDDDDDDDNNNDIVIGNLLLNGDLIREQNRSKNDDEYFTMEDSDILTLIIQAVCNDNDTLMKFINDNIYKIDLFKHIYISDTIQYDVIQLSVLYGAIRCLKYITSRPDFKVSFCNKNNYSILRLAILFNQSEVLKFLLSFKGLNINNTEKEGGSAFTAATWDNQIPLVKILYKHGGVDINMKGKLGETPLTGTVLQNTPKMMELLLSYPEINVYEVNKDNKTPMMLCLENNTVDCFFCLVQCDKFDINSEKSCVCCSTAKYCLLSSDVPVEMIKIVMEVPNINLKEMYEGHTIEDLLNSKIKRMKSEKDNPIENDHKRDIAAP